MHAIRVLYTLLFIDMLGVALVVPIVPYIGDQLGMTATEHGLLQASYQVTQLVGNTMIGGMGDVFGEKQVLFISCLGSAISYIMLGTATSTWMLFVSRLLVGLIKQSTTVSTAILSNLPDTTVENRSIRMSQISTVMAMAFFIGPMLGGVLSKYFSYSASIYIACGLFILDIFLLNFLEVPAKPVESQQNSDSKEKQSIFQQVSQQFKLIIKAINMPSIRQILFLQMIHEVIQRLFRFSYQINVKNRFNLSASNSGFLMSYFGVLNVISGALFVPLFASSHNLMYKSVLGTVLMGLGLIGDVLSINFTTYIVTMAFFVMGSSLLSNSMTSEYTQQLTKNGGVGFGLGVRGSLGAFIGIFIPTVAGLLTDHYGLKFSSLGAVFCSVFLIGLFYLLNPFHKQESNVKME